MDDLINRLRQQLKLPLPGIESQYEMAPLNRQRSFDDTKELSTYRQSAVLILLYKNEADSWELPLIKRVNTGGVHGGQVSFPGGAFDTTDLNIQNTAIRETKEEIGIENLTVIGSLTELYIPVSQFKVKPFIGFCTAKIPEFKLSVHEVEQIIELPLHLLLNNDFRKEGYLEDTKYSKVKTPYFEVKGFKVWGATAMILNEFKAVLKPIY